VPDTAALLAANASFYDAFEARDLDAMSDAWEHSERVVCTHPGWSTLRGWGPVAASWFSLFAGAQHLQFIVTNEHAEIIGEVGLVTCDENILGNDGSGTVAAMNVFTWRQGRWLLLAHHGSAVMG
jgi:ketosteroid isomerase-like protein